MKGKAILEWLPGIITFVLAMLLVAYVYTGHVPEGYEPGNNWVQFIGAGLSPFFFPIYGLITKKKLPLSLAYIWGVQVILGSYLGSGLRWYDSISWYDLLTHGTFGLVGSLIIFVFLLRRNGQKMGKLACMIIIFLCVLGIAAIWEIIEYTTDVLTGSDSQMIADSINSGKSPNADTMEDIIITLAGIAAFYIIFFLDLGFSKLAYKKRMEKQGEEDIDTRQVGGAFFHLLIGFEGFNHQSNNKELTN